MPCQFIDAAQESTAAQLCPSGLKLNILATWVVTFMTQVPSYCPSFQSFLCVCSFSLCSEPACFYIRYFCHLYLVHYAKALLEHEPKVAFPGTDPSGCVIPVPLHTAGLGLSAAQAPCVTSLHPPTRHVGGKPVLQHCFFSSIGCGGDQQQLPSTCSTISAG